MHTCPNNKVYIGMTRRNPLTRWKNGNGYSENREFYQDILLYGWDNIKHEILYSDLSKEDATAKEIELIEKYNATNPKCGYNKAIGGQIPWNLGKNLSVEIRSKISSSHKGKHLSDEQKKHIRLFAKKSGMKFSKSRREWSLTILVNSLERLITQRDARRTR